MVPDSVVVSSCLLHFRRAHNIVMTCRETGIRPSTRSRAPKCVLLYPHDVLLCAFQIMLWGLAWTGQTLPSCKNALAGTPAQTPKLYLQAL